MTKLVVLDEMISSMTEFKQIIGRGTRLRGRREGKTHFVGMDFRAVTPLFADRIGTAPSGDRRGLYAGRRQKPRGGSPRAAR